ncbi:Fe-S cluster assembly sulfur transfer protein SufU [Anaerorhabdus furcosa]|uniref:Nitrogen fixation protein NifU n=1 Tax=Anaerorhabdus furcosa TaxID=118967 RepID=A0A1T4NAC9_9FIRM|nr:SUF system NifU family Fe-S cluster assembly protein [Anaerorhabdus furcosa]SJZ76219.1 nitrogen fixation protein NifU [Anaerorhabdus furcosa]
MTSLLNDPQVLRELIMDHYQYPRHHALKEDTSYASVHMASDSCIDDITVQSKIEGDLIQDICFDGVACTIATASTSMMTELLVGKTIDEANLIIDNYYAMIDEKEYDPEILQEAIALKGVSKQANRIKCATIGWKAIRQMIDERENAK